MSGQHTPEPWPVGATPISSKDEVLTLFKQSLDAHTGDLGGFFFEIFTDDGKRIAFLVGPSASANSRRIVACVNACAGIPTEQLEGIGENSALQTAARVKNAELITQRNQLLSALKGMVEVARLMIGWHRTPPGANGPLVVAEQAIASVEAQL